jgi:hypothetical protein
MHSVSEFRLDPDTGEYEPYVIGNDGQLMRVAWAPQPGSQEVFLKCPEVEVLFEGTRGNGKTIALILDFVQHVGVGFGADWRGILFRRSHPQLREAIALSNKWIKKFCPDAAYNEMKSFWKWPTGEQLTFAHFDVPSQFDDYMGTSFPWIGWEELTMWDNLDCYRVMFACSRSTRPGMPRKVRATTNPYGRAHNHVMQRFRLPLKPGHTLGPLIEDAKDDKGNPEPARRVVHGHLSENLLLHVVDPDYIKNITAAATNEAQLRAWRDGDWLIVAGGILDDLWHEYRHVCVVPKFEVPASWRMHRSYDHGSSKPYCVLFWAESDGTDLTLPDGKVRATLPHDVFCVGELYGWNGRPNEGTREMVPGIASKLKQYEVARGWRTQGGKSRVRPGPADTSIFDDVNGHCIASDFESSHGITWEKADKGPHSRVLGLDQLRKRIKESRRPEDSYRETAGIFICDCCTNWLRTVPTLQRDEKNMDDADSDGEDHAYDATRYFLRWDGGPRMTSGRVCGP